jgi:hypothetical protein
MAYREKAWDCDLPENPFLRARYWTDKAEAAREQAALRTGAEAAAWAALADHWKQAIQHIKYPPIAVPGHRAPRKPAH